MKLSDFNYELPPELIAQHPAAERSASRLLHLDGGSGEFHDRRFRDLPQLVNAGDVLVMNDTRVIKARLTGSKQSGGQVEVLIERVLDHERVIAQVHASKSPRAGTRLLLAHGAIAEVLGREGEFFELRFIDCNDVFALLERAGSVPLPPYIRHQPDAGDAARYQTIYAREPGAVAAPTAGLHFDDALLAALSARGVTPAWLTLHVGAGTFQPVRVEDLAEHRMHGEWYSLPRQTVDAIHAAHAAGRSVIAVGTTSLRALEAAAASGELRAGSAETRLFVVPGYRFSVVDRLITNFHLPRSTLLMLVCAFAGMDNVRRAYRHAVESRYRFFSYGDAMLIERQKAWPQRTQRTQRTQRKIEVQKQKPETRDRYPHFLTITTRWMDNDVYTHVNNVVYYSWFDTVVNEYMLREGVLSMEDGPICLVVETGCRYFSPISFPDSVHCGLRVAHLGKSSVRFEIGIFRNDEPAAAAQGHFVHVCCDRDTHRPLAMPDDMRAALEKLRV